MASVVTLYHIGIGQFNRLRVYDIDKRIELLS